MIQKQSTSAHNTSNREQEVVEMIHYKCDEKGRILGQPKVEYKIGNQYFQPIELEQKFQIKLEELQRELNKEKRNKNIKRNINRYIIITMLFLMAAYLIHAQREIPKQKTKEIIVQNTGLPSIKKENSPEKNPIKVQEYQTKTAKKSQQKHRRPEKKKKYTLPKKKMNEAKQQQILSETEVIALSKCEGEQQKIFTVNKIVNQKLPLSPPQATNQLKAAQNQIAKPLQENIKIKKNQPKVNLKQPAAETYIFQQFYVFAFQQSFVLKSIRRDVKKNFDDIVRIVNPSQYSKTSACSIVKFDQQTVTYIYSNESFSLINTKTIKLEPQQIKVKQYNLIFDEFIAKYGLILQQAKRLHMFLFTKGPFKVQQQKLKLFGNIMKKNLKRMDLWIVNLGEQSSRLKKISKQLDFQLFDVNSETGKKEFQTKLKKQLAFDYFA